MVVVVVVMELGWAVDPSQMACPFGGVHLTEVVLVCSCEDENFDFSPDNNTLDRSRQWQMLPMWGFSISATYFFFKSIYPHTNVRVFIQFFLCIEKDITQLTPHRAAISLSHGIESGGKTPARDDTVGGKSKEKYYHFFSPFGLQLYPSRPPRAPG